MRGVLLFGISFVLLATGACAERPKPRVPLALAPTAPSLAQGHTDAALRLYQSGQFLEAKSEFQLALAAAPQSGEAHYNLGLALFALGETDQAREHFIEAANLSPGNKVIWDSPALRPYGSPEPNIAKPTKEAKPPRGGGFGGPGGFGR